MHVFLNCCLHKPKVRTCWACARTRRRESRVFRFTVTLHQNVSVHPCPLSFSLTPLSESSHFLCITIGTIVVVIVSLWMQTICLLIKKLYFLDCVFFFHYYFNSLIILPSMMTCLLPMVTMALWTLKWTGLILSLSSFVWIVSQDTLLWNVMGTLRHFAVDCNIDNLKFSVCIYPCSMNCELWPLLWSGYEGTDYCYYFTVLSELQF